MTEPRTKPGVAFWATVAVLVALLAYPLSFGPACWLVSHDLLPLKSTWYFFRPITWLAEEGPEATAYPIYWWARIFEPWDPEENPNNEAPSLLYWQSYHFEE